MNAVNIFGFLFIRNNVSLFKAITIQASNQCELATINSEALDLLNFSRLILKPVNFFFFI